MNIWEAVSVGSCLEGCSFRAGGPAIEHSLFAVQQPAFQVFQ